MKTMLKAGCYAPKGELRKYAANIFETEKLLQKFEFNQELKRSGIWLEVEEVKRRASFTLQKMLDCNLIQDGLIVAGMLEYIKEVVEC